MERNFDNFKCAIDQNPFLGNVQRMIYLKGLLWGSALSIVSCFKLSNENCTSTLNLLRECFDNKKLQIQAHIWKHLKIPPVSSLNDI